MTEGLPLFGRLRVAKDKPCLTLEASAGSLNNITVEKIHISCGSAKFDESKNFIGIVLYQYDGKNIWELNNVRCRSGYVFFQEADKLKEVPGETMHARAYYQLFGVQPPNTGNLVASGFAYRDGQWLQNSSTFNAKETPYTEKNCREGVTEFDVIQKAILSRSRGGCQNYDTAGWQANAQDETINQDTIGCDVL